MTDTKTERKLYRLKADSSFPKALSKLSGNDDDAVYATEGRTYAAGDFISSGDMTPRDAKRAESGELDHLLEPVSDEEFEAAGGGMNYDDPRGLFIAEHEAEAHVLEQYGHTVVPPEQALELSTGGDLAYAHQYREAVAEHGLDKRPVQEHNARTRERIPDEHLTGGESRSGVPHDRGPVGFSDAQRERQEQESENGEANEGGSEETQSTESSRPAPPQSQEGQGE